MAHSDSKPDTVPHGRRNEAITDSPLTSTHIPQQAQFHTDVHAHKHKNNNEGGQGKCPICAKGKSEECLYRE